MQEDGGLTLRILGDLHGDFSRLESIAVDGLTIQVGDFGVYEDTLPAIRRLKLKAPVWFIDGNHEQHELLLGDAGEEPFEGVKNLYFVPRGSVAEWEGKRIGFLGGASSVDKYIRLNRGLHWSPRETPTAFEASRLIPHTELVDLLITHCPPQSVIDAHFDPQDLQRYFGLPVTWLDPTAAYVELLWEAHARCPLYCGHMHRSVTEGSVRILNIGEVLEIP
jgi:hypothetical protein